ncbi:Small subunit (SSU) processome component [Lambiella insularis]|nr:Small subunit (SSU) processome component [Lambiella insularis]
MVSKKSSGHAVSKSSSAAAPASFSLAKTINSSSILYSAFSPSRFQLSLFASVIQRLDLQQLRIHDTVAGRLIGELSVGPRVRVTCLDWGYFGLPPQNSQSQSSKKKRKRSEEVNGSPKNKNAVVAVGTSSLGILIFSPNESKTVQTLKGGHTQGIKDFKFAEDGLTSTGWSLGDDGKLTQWDITRGTTVRSIDVPHQSVTKLHPLQHELLCASNTAYLIDPSTPGKIQPFSGCKTPIHTILAAPFDHSRPETSFLAAAHSDRYINVYDTSSTTLLGSLIAHNDVRSLSFIEKPIVDQINRRRNGLLAAVTDDGEVELFSSPFFFQASSNPTDSMSLKSKIRQKTRKPEATIQVRKNTAAVVIIDATLEESDVVVVWVDGGVNLNFERLPWRDEIQNNLALVGQQTIQTARTSAPLNAITSNGVKEFGPSHVNDAHTIVAKGGEAEDVMEVDEVPEVINISSAEEEEEESASEEEEDGRAQALSAQTSSFNGLTNGGTEIMDTSVDVNQASKGVEDLTFGELIRANAPNVVDVSTAFSDPNKHALAPLKGGASKLPSGVSLGTVLTQSLRTNDVSLLETCFHVHDLSVVRATIERLDSVLAANLLQKLAERLHSRPGRAGSLMVWVQWTLVAHGGYVASQPEVVKKLLSLHRVVKERASSLQPLLALKGKLDMLEAQMNLRKSMQSRFGAPEAEDGNNEDGVIYVEGQEESSSDDEMETAADASRSSKLKIRRDEHSDTNEMLSDSDEEMDDVPSQIDNGVSGSNGSLSESDENGFIDDEASDSNDESSGSEDMEDEVDHEDVDSVGDDEESDIEAPPLKATRAMPSNGLAFKK